MVIACFIYLTSNQGASWRGGGVKPLLNFHSRPVSFTSSAPGLSIARSGFESRWPQAVA